MVSLLRVKTGSNEPKEVAKGAYTEIKEPLIVIRYPKDVSTEVVYEPQAVLRADYPQVELCVGPKMLTEREFGDSTNPVG